jgi:hypothetical protein
MPGRYLDGFVGLKIPNWLSIHIYVCMMGGSIEEQTDEYKEKSTSRKDGD